jgi:NAD(P)-dependent dehydrogenase (short-subunit alcohol dehydrogenase family)
MRVLPAVLAHPRPGADLGVNPLAGKAILVTGAARGIGAAVAEAVVDEGGGVALLDIDPIGADTAARLADRGSAHFFPCDVRSLEQVELAVAEAERTLGGLDGLVNNAGVNAYFDAVAMGEGDWDRVFAVDLKAAWMLAKATLPGLIERRGAIVNISSIHARLTIEGFFPYAAAKAGLEGLTRSLALEYAPAGVRVNAVAPGYTDTRLVRDWLDLQADPGAALESALARIPLGRLATPHEIAAAVVFLLSDGASAITGATLAVDCGVGVLVAT